MTNFNDFNKVSKDDWIQKIQSDLKGKDLSILDINDPIEELNFSGYFHNEEANENLPLPGNFPFSRGMNSPNNNWNIGALIEIEFEDLANNKALKLLNEGAELLVFKALKENINWESVLDSIQVEFIQIQFVIQNKNDLAILKTMLSDCLNNVQFNLDFLSDYTAEEIQEIATTFTTKQIPFCSVNGFKIQQSGATTWQEIAFCLSTGHEYIVKLMEAGFSIDEAAACISFKIGMGSNYFYETAKIRALKMLWSKIIVTYEPEHNCSHKCNITAVVGHMNKSLLDPYTNLLRQTTEAMSAINGSIDNLVILPYDGKSKEGSSDLAERMALNISSILKEESYFDKVIDPLGGSYSVEQVTELIGEKSWHLFQKMDAQGGTLNSAVLKAFIQEVENKKKIRIENIQSGNQVLIGINKFKNPDLVNNSWKEPDNYLGIDQLIYEKECKILSA